MTSYKDHVEIVKKIMASLMTILEEAPGHC